MQPGSRALIVAAIAVWAVTFVAFAGNDARITAAGVTPDGLNIVLNVDTCSADLRVEVGENPQHVIVWVFARNDSSNDCGDIHVLQLKDPLGTRTLTDASTGSAIDLRSVPALGE